MGRFTVARDVSDWDETDLEAAALRSKLCVPWFDGMQWVISYLDRERGAMTCIYEASSEDDIRAHARFSGLPCGEIRPVDEIDPAAVGADAPEALAGAASEVATTLDLPSEDAVERAN